MRKMFSCDDVLNKNQVKCSKNASFRQKIGRIFATVFSVCVLCIYFAYECVIGQNRQ